MDNNKATGAFLFAGVSQFLVMLTIAETQFPGYSVALNYISDLGLWSYPSAIIFNTSVALNGVFVLAAGYLVIAKFGWRIQGLLLALSGMGAVGVGFFNELVLVPHAIFAMMAFVGSAAAAIAFSRRLRGFMGLAGIALGRASLLALFAMLAGFDFGLGPGGIERMVMYPSLIFSFGLGGYFLAGQENRGLKDLGQGLKNQKTSHGALHILRSWPSFSLKP
ncbi:MAG: DUF998 domain-containing protein [Candidatus Methanomethylicus sp.]|nr:DUF998 domain-containing protein [Candidatus Methanomethylicus sp.]